MKSLNAFISWEQRGFCRSLKTRDAYSCPLVPDPSVKIGQASLSRSCSYRGQDFSFVLVTLSPNCFPIQTQAQMRPASDATATCAHCDTAVNEVTCVACSWQNNSWNMSLMGSKAQMDWCCMIYESTVKQDSLWSVEVHSDALSWRWAELRLQTHLQREKLH